MTAYSDVYVSSVMRTQGKMFLNMRDKLPNVDEKWYIESYMKSKIRALIDEGNVKFVNAPFPEIILRFIEDECG